MHWKIYPIAALKDNYIWALVNNKQEAIIVDPGDAKPVLNYLTQQSLRLKAILITHKHWDHTNGILAITNVFPVPVYGPRHDYAAGATELVSDGNKITFPSFPGLEVLAIPGHTLGHVAYTGENILFSGDTLFSAGCGRVFEGTIEQMLTSLQKLSSLAATTQLYCGHEYTLNNLRFAEKVEPDNKKIKERILEVQYLRKQDQCTLPVTLQTELETNPFLRCQCLDVIKGAEQHIGRSLDSEAAVFGVLREWKNRSY